MFVPVGISNRHIHLTKEDFTLLFGKEEMTIKSNLKQPKNYACEEVLTIKSDKAEIKNVRILGPFRPYTQVELAGTDARILGINPPVRESGDVENSEFVTLIGPAGSLKVGGVILPQRHIHITYEDKEKLNLPDVVSIEVQGVKGGLISDVHIKASEEAFFEVHLDTDEANAFRLKNDQELEIKFQ